MRDLLVDEMSDKLDHGCTNGFVVAFIAPPELHHDPLHNSLTILWKLGVDDGSEGCVNLDSFEKSNQALEMCGIEIKKQEHWQDARRWPCDCPEYHRPLTGEKAGEASCAFMTDRA